MWEALRKRRTGFLFKTQAPVGPYFLDFYCPEASLCVEVDGEQHFERQEKDQVRDKFLKTRGIETIRVPSLDLFEKDTDAYSAWIRVITEACENRAGREGFSPPPTPSSSA